MKPVTVNVEVGRPAADVWEYLVNAEHNPQWLKNMSSCRWLTPPPIRIGSQYEQHARFLGKDVRTTFEVSALEHERLVTITSLPGSSFPLTITRKVKPIGPQRCLVTEIAGGDASGFYRVAEAPMRFIVRRNIARAYQNLRHLLEA